MVILILILIVFWLIRRFSGGRFGNSGPKSRQPRLSVLDALPIDQRRRLILVRRDNVEHLLLIGGPSDVVVEASIQRLPPGQRRAEAQPPRPVAAKGAPTSSGEAQRAAAVAMEHRRPEPQPPEPEFPPQEAPPRAIETAPAESLPSLEPSEPSIEETAPVAARPQPQPASRPMRGVPAFLTGGRSRQSQPAEPNPPRREARNRVAEAARAETSRPETSRPEPSRAEASRPLQRATPSPFSREPIRQEPASEPVEAPVVRGPMPPAPPVEPTSPFGSEPFGTPESASPSPLRFEPVFGHKSEAELAPLAEDPSLIPDVAPPSRDDQPVAFDETFGEDLPVPHQRDATVEAADDETEPAKERASQVGDLEKEMARLLGEISGNKR
ncbi:hypothetical protein C3941_20700 [Kaistia algarum]|nr:hypothetical protein C3941_20700 [Kaistia algarum]